MFDGSRTETALPQKVKLEVAEKFSAFGLRSSEWRSRRHADFDQVLDEQFCKIGNFDLAFRGNRQPPPQFDGKVWR